MAFSTLQQQYLNEATARWNIKIGATRSGKTYLDYFVIPKRLRSLQDDGLVVFIGNTQATLERNIFDPLRNLWGEALVGHVRSANKIRLFGKECYALGADKKTSVARLQGAGIAYAYGDEITTWSEPVFQMLKSRLDKPHSLFDGTCNPDSPNHWFKRFLESGADIYSQHYTIDDNPFLTKSFVENLKREYQGTVYYDRYILGRWQRAEGVIYDMFNRALHTTERPNHYGESYIAVDYGTQNPTVFLRIARTEKGFCVVDEYYYSGREEGRQKTDASYVRDMQAFIGSDKPRAVIVDPSAASFIAALREARIHVRKADNNVLDGIRRTGAAFAQERLFVAENCRHTLEELESYSWDAQAALRGEDKPLKENDHAMDALRYFVNTILYGARLQTLTKNAFGL